MIKGIVQGEFEFRDKNCTFTLPVHPDVYIHDAYEGKDGTLGYCLRGIKHEYLLSGIWKDVEGQAEKNRVITIHYLKEIEQAIRERKTYVHTVFGFKYIFYPKSMRKEKIDFDFPMDLLTQSDF